ncbi:hypothetical protein SAMN04490190_1758 [Pseudomonas libanensis]|nr:hypothetical protein SAMN04490190_1758 [Pseudomonas libanensis]
MRNTRTLCGSDGNHDAQRAALDLDLLLILILGAPLNHAGRNSTGIWGVNRQGCRFSRPAPWMARGGGPPNPCRITGTPSLSEVPSGGARAFGYFALFKVTRCKSGTNSGRYLNNGYVLGLIQDPGRLSGRLRGQAPSHIWMHQLDSYKLPGSSGVPTLCRYLFNYCTASPLPARSRLRHNQTGKTSGSRLSIRFFSANPNSVSP